MIGLGAEPRRPVSQATLPRGGPAPTHSTGKGVEAGEVETKTISSAHVLSAASKQGEPVKWPLSFYDNFTTEPCVT